MADKMNIVVKGDSIKTIFNFIAQLFNDGNYGNEKTEAQIIAIITADNTKRVIAHNTDTDQLEYWFVKEGKNIRRVIC